MPIPEQVLEQILAASLAEGVFSTVELSHALQGDPRVSRTTARWIDEAGETIGNPQPFRVSTAPVEAFRPDGSIDRQQAPVHVPIDPPSPRAQTLELRNLERVIARVERVDLEIPPPMPSVEPKLWPAEIAGTLFFPIFSERFSDRQRFYDHVAVLNTFIGQIEPFNRPEIGNRLQLRAYFWPTPTPDRGWFDSPDILFDCSSTETSLFYGNRETAKARLGHLMFRRKYGLVLVDSPYRGGAGGQDEYGYPAWSTVTSCPGENWCAIALHEIGHAFGLGDEYIMDSLAHLSVDGEPNIGFNADMPPADWPTSPGWGGQIVTEAQQAAMDPQVPGTESITGFFQGARYRHDYCRPSLNCLMKATAKIPSLDRYAFCKVCEAALIEAITGA